MEKQPGYVFRYHLACGAAELGTVARNAKQMIGISSTSKYVVQGYLVRAGCRVALASSCSFYHREHPESVYEVLYCIQFVS